MLKEMAIEEGAGIVALTESHLNSDYHEGEIAIDQFTHFRADRCEGIRKGGVILYIHNSISPGAKLVTAESYENIEYAVLNIPAASMTLVCIYRPPTANLPAFTHALARINQSLNQLPPHNSVIFCGDLNFPNLRWPSATIVAGGPQSARLQAQALLDFFSDHFLQQLIEKPTRGNNILDLLAADNDQLV